MISVTGRPIPEKLDIRQYIETVRDTLRVKIVTGFREDDIMMIEGSLTLEQRIIDTIKGNLQEYINGFEEFLYLDHNSAMRLLKEADAAAQSSFEKYEEYKLEAKRLSSLSTSLFTIEEKWRLCKTYQKFLYTVSPIPWKMAQSSTRRASVYLLRDESESEDYHSIGALRSSIGERGISLSDIVAEFKNEIKQSSPPKLYFTKPEELMEVFRFMEMQNLNSLLHAEELAVPLQSIKETMEMAETSFDMEVKSLEELVVDLAVGIS